MKRDQVVKKQVIKKTNCETILINIMLSLLGFTNI